MGWEQFKGHTERVDTSKIGSNSGNFAKAFGDAFGQIGNDMINAKAQARKDELLGLQIQNEQAKIDAATEAKKAKKVDDAFKSDINTLDLNNTAEAKQNAIDSLKAFYNPSVDTQSAVATDIANKEKVITAQNNDTYKGMVLNAPNKQELADAWAMSDLADRGYKPSADIVKERDTFYQGKFNDEAIETSVSGGYKNMAEYTKANPELVKNADGITMSKIEAFYANKDKDATDKADKDRTFKLNEDKFKHEVSNDNQTLEISRTKANNGGDGGSALPWLKFDYQQERDQKLDAFKEKQIRTKDANEVFDNIEGFKKLPKANQLLYKKEYIDSGYIPTSTVDDSGMFGKKYIFSMPEHLKTKSTKQPTNKQDNRPALSEL